VKRGKGRGRISEVESVFRVNGSLFKFLAEGTEYFFKSFFQLIPHFFSQDIPTQNNGDDYGVFVCQLALDEASQSSHNFSASDVPHIRKRMEMQVITMGI